MQKSTDLKTLFTSIKASNFLFPSSPMSNGRLKETMHWPFIITPA